MARLKQAATSLRYQITALLLVMAAFLGAGFLAGSHIDGSIQDMIRATTIARLQAAAAQDVLSALQEAEAGQRGYLLTGRQAYLEPYYVAAGRIDSLLTKVETRLAIGMPGRAEAGARLVAAARLKMTELGQTIAQAQAGNRETVLAALATDDSRLQMDEARSAATRIIERSEQERATRASMLQQRQGLVTDLLLCALVGGVMLLGAAAMVLLTNLARLRAARKAEQLQAAQLEAAIEHVPDGVGVFDPAGKLTLRNRRFGPMLALAAAQAQPGATLAEIAKAAALDPPLLDGERPTSPLASEVRQAGRTLEVWRSPMPGGGQILAVADLTRRVAAEEVARQAQKMDVLGQMTGGVAHDFNNLLQVVSANLELVRTRLERGEAGGPLLARLDAASAGVARGARLTRHLLAFARRQPLAPQALEPAFLLQGMDEVLRRTLGETIQLEIVVGNDLWAMRADPTQFENALLNLALNARDALLAQETERDAASLKDGPAAKLTIEAMNAALNEGFAAEAAEVTPGQYIMFSVTDNGPGMTAAQASRAIEPFYTTKLEGRGTGLGLPMVLGFAKQSGGHFHLESEPGRGTIARMYIPRTTAAVTRAEPSPERVPLGENELILLVEDDDAVRAAAREALLALGYRIIEADSAQAGMELLEAGAAPKILFTDVVMPGPVTARQLAARATELLPGIAVLFTSGYTRNSIVHNGQLDPGVNLISKPWRSDELARALRGVLTKPPTQPPTPPSARPRVLLVEDEEAIRTATADALTEQGFEVIEAANIPCALSRLDPPLALLVTDLGLPGGNGMDLVAEARIRIPGLPVIIASGQTDTPDADVVWLAKPFDANSLRQAVTKALSPGERVG